MTERATVDPNVVYIPHAVLKPAKHRTDAYSFPLHHTDWNPESAKPS